MSGPRLGEFAEPRSYDELAHLTDTELARLDAKEFEAFLIGYRKALGKAIPSAAEQHYARTLRSERMKKLFVESVRHAERA